MTGRPLLRSLAARAAHPVIVAVDARIERLAARLELHTLNLANEQRCELARIDERAAVDGAVAAEHLLTVERIARRVVGDLSPQPGGEPATVLVALPGEAMQLPAGAQLVACYERDSAGEWHRVAPADETRTDTLRIATPPRPAS